MIRSFRFSLLAVLLQGLAGSAGAGAADLQHPSTEAEWLAFMREEEKLARDVYTALADQDPIFARIARSEQQHMEVVGRLLDRRGLPDPAEGKAVGEFQSPAIRAQHEALVARGQQSQLAALEVGVEIEELDLRDLAAARAAARSPDLRRVLENLERASRNHLREFHSRLSALGGSYTPRHLAPEVFTSILESPLEPGPGRGRRWE